VVLTAIVRLFLRYPDEGLFRNASLAVLEKLNLPATGSPTPRDPFDEYALS
jgi:hypothetical protein